MIEIHLDVLFRRDAQGRLVETRDPTARPAPRAYLGRSAEGNVWALRGDLRSAVAEELRRLWAAETPPNALHEAHAPACRARVLELLAPVVVEHRGPCYVLPDDLPLDERARLIDPSERGRWPDAFPWLADEFDAIAPVAIAFEHGQPAAICHSPRGRTEHAVEAGVETRTAFRGRGLGTAAVACWGRAVQRSGRRALYSTSWDDAASMRIAQRLGARLYGESWHLT